tara:strand:- start:1515 stop:2096 length:582 start_codon:yes stop_codon:yes gene_type:complete
MFFKMKQDQPETTETQQSQQTTLDHPQPDHQEELSGQQNTSSQQTNEADYFDDLINDHETAQAEEQQEQVKATMLTKEQFIQSFFGLHGAAAAVTGIQALALPNSRINHATGSEIAEMFYETILDIPILHFMLYPENKWLGRGVMMIVYVQGMRGAIAEERGSKAKKAPEPRNPDKHPKGEVKPDQAAALGAA